MKVKVSVTRTHITKGTRGCPDKCAVQIALQKALRTELGRTVNLVTVSYLDLSFWKGGNKYVTKTPKKVGRFMAKFDDYTIPRSKIKPMTFSIRFNGI